MAVTRSFTVGTEPIAIADVPPGSTILVQNTGAAAVTVSVDVPAVAGKGIILAGGNPGGSVSTQPPGDPEPQRWWAVTATGTTTVSTLVV